MGTPHVNDLDSLLSSLNQLKPPGASKTKITTITTLCVNNIQAETTIVQSFYRALKKAPTTHKLGALYVIDSVVRQWIEKAKASGQDLHIEGRGEPGTYPAAVKRITELMPALFDDIIKGIPAEQKPKLENMIAIWDKGSTFPTKMLAEFKSRLGGDSSRTAAVSSASSAPAVQQTGNIAVGATYTAPMPTRISTPSGYPPPYLYEQGYLPGRSAPPTQANGTPALQQQPPPVASASTQGQQFQQRPPQSTPAPSAPATDVNSILAALSKAASAAPAAAPAPTYPPSSQSTAPPTAVPAGIPPQIAALFSQQHLAHAPPAQAGAPAQPAFAYSAPAPPANQFPAYQASQPYPGYPPQPPASIPQAYHSAAPPVQISQPQQPPQLQQTPQQAVIAQLRGFLPENILNDSEKLIPALKLLQELQQQGVSSDKWAPVLQAFEEQYQPAAPGYNGQSNYAAGRGRSRSPDRAPRGRGSPVYDSYDANARDHANDSRDPRGQNQRGRYRQRSPIRNSPSAAGTKGNIGQAKYVVYDNSLPPGNVKVLSRTLFVGGANGSQQDINDLFERFGRVQTCIANRDKRHAFVKMTTREHALAAKAAMEDLQSRNDRDAMSIARQTKWGVGFGPRECCDYQRGESVIPIHKLTEADLKWIHTAEYGGTGGQKLEGGMVIEEPDIEIGAGVSSKAMSKRIGPDGGAGHKRQRDDRDRGGRHGKNKNSDPAFGGGSGYSGVSGGGQQQQQQQQMEFVPLRPEPVAVATPPAVPGFGFSFLPPANGQNSFR